LQYRLPKFIPVILFLISFISIPVSAQWSSDPYENTFVSVGQGAMDVSDGEGGILMVYCLGSEYICCTRVDRMGYIRWPIGSVQVLGELDELWLGGIAADGNNGLLLSYRDVEWIVYPYSADGRIRVQRIDSNGQPLWGNNGIGVRVTSSDNNETCSSVSSDAHGGAIVTWIKETGSPDEYYVQRLDSSGEKMWGDEGILLGYSTSPSTKPCLITFSADSCFIEQYIQDLTAHYQKINLAGEFLWGDEGTACTIYCTTELFPTAGGGFITSGRFLNMPGNYYSVIAQSLNTSGEILWGEGLTLADTISSGTSRVPGSANNDGGVTFTWYRNFNQSPSMFNIFSQRVYPDGSVAWQNNGVPVSSNEANRSDPQIIDSVNDSKIFVFNDRRIEFSDIFAQRLDSDGNQVWAEDVPVCIRTGDQDYHSVVSDMAGGVIISWFETPYLNIYVQQVSVNGNLGEVLYVPPITDLTISVSDGIVHLDWQDIDYVSGYKVFSSSEYPVSSIPENLLTEVTISEYSGTIASPGYSLFYMVVAAD